MAKIDTLFEKLQEFCLSLPETRVQTSWGKPHYRVGKKVFLGVGEKDKPNAISFALEPEHADMLVETDPRFERSRYAKSYPGAIMIDAAEVKSFAELKKLVLQSYKLRAPKKAIAQLEDKKTKPGRGRPGRRAK